MKKNIFALFCVVAFGASAFGASDVELGKKYQYKKDYNKAWDFYQKACDSGDLLGCKESFIVSRSAEPTPDEIQKEIDENEKTCNGGDLEACATLGWAYYYRGDISKSDYKKAYN